MSLRGIVDNIFLAEDNIEAMLKKLESRKTLSLQNNVNHFSTISVFLESAEEVFPRDVQDIKLLNIFKFLKSSFRNYFPVQDKNKKLRSRPF